LNDAVAVVDDIDARIDLGVLEPPILVMPGRLFVRPAPMK